MLKPQDIVIILKMIAIKNSANVNLEDLSQNELATFLCMSVSEVNAGIKRLIISGLLTRNQRAKRMVYIPILAAIEECLVHGVKYFFPVCAAGISRGIATAYAAPIFAQELVLGNDPIPVWPYENGKDRGVALAPLYSSVPLSLEKYPDELFYELLALVDAIRVGRARERNLGIKILKEKIYDKSIRHIAHH